MDHEFEIGSIIEFDDGDDLRVGVVVDTIGKKKLAVLTASGDRMRTVPKDVTAELGTGPADDDSRAQKKLTSLESDIAGRKADVELEMLWEFAREDDEPKSAAFLADLMFAEDDPATVAALRRALREDPTYFKRRRDGLYEPRSDGQVASLKRQREAELERQAERRRILDTIASTLKLPADERRARIEAAMGDDDALRDGIYLLQDFAAHGQDYSRRDEAVELLDDIIAAIDQHLDGHMDQKAFDLMRHLGLWEEHENLALHRFRITAEFPDELVAQAQELSDQPWEPEPWRTDLTHLRALTIDSPSTRDIDDALSCQPTIDGGWELFIHIADPSAYVDRGTALDKEARSRGTSVYLPGQTVPMFPPVLSEDKMSLVAGERRPALTTKVIFDDQLQIVDQEIIASVVEVNHRLSYDEADKLLAGDQSGPIADLLRNLAFLADECRLRREEEGATSFNLPDIKIEVDRQVDPPQVEVSAVETDTPSRDLVSELMILNNDQVGRFCARNDIPVIYRVQEPPDQPLEDDEILSIPEGPARTFAQIRRMNPGTITTHPSIHFGLGLHTYAQASSPIRRYSDLMCQRQLKAFLNDQPLPYDNEAVLEVLSDVDRAAGNAYSAEKDTQRYWLTYYLKQRGDEPMEAVVVEHYDAQASRVSVFLSHCAYRSKCTLRSKVAVGEQVAVVVERANPRFDVLRLRQAPNES